MSRGGCIRRQSMLGACGAVRVVALAWPRQALGSCLPVLCHPEIDHESRKRRITKSPTLQSFPYFLRYGDSCAFCIVFAAQCAVFSPGAADPMLEIGTASQKDNFSDIGTSPARFKGWSGWSSTCENDQVHFRVVGGDNRK